MSQSLAKNLIHLVFSTKHRERTLLPEVRPELHAYLAAALARIQSPAVVINSVWDHVHILFNLHRTQALSHAVMEVKRSSSRWLKGKHWTLKEFRWQDGYGAFSVSQSGLADVKRYIETQEEHHRLKTFQDEFRQFLKRYEIDYDESHVWD
jgi:REP element-mobilizing transposase RayT